MSASTVRACCPFNAEEDYESDLEHDSKHVVLDAFPTTMSTVSRSKEVEKGTHPSHNARIIFP